MSLQARAMRVHPRTPATEPWHLTRKVVLLFLLVVATAEGLVLLRRHGTPAPLVLYNILADASIGVVVGLGTRIVLRRRSGWLKVLVSAALAIFGLVILGLLTDATSGIGPLRFETVGVDWLDPLGVALRVPRLPRSASTDLMDAAHMMIAIDVSWIALRAWNARGRSKSGGSGWARTSARPAPAPVVGSVPHVSTHGSLVSPSISRRPPRRKIRPSRAGPSTRVHAVPISGRRPLPLWRSFRRRVPAVHLARYEQHRCPYCLEEMARSDGHGSVECPICHTLHHKDCWDVTGTCQVPHLSA
jgi:ribosomal protein L37AE/L43A